MSFNFVYDVYNCRLTMFDGPIDVLMRIDCEINVFPYKVGTLKIGNFSNLCELICLVFKLWDVLIIMILYYNRLSINWKTYAYDVSCDISLQFQF